MKHFFTIFLCLVCCFTAKAQNTYDSLVVEGAHWFVEFAGPLATYDIPTNVYFIQGDSVINGKTYKKMYTGSYGDNNPQTATVSTYPTTQNIWLHSCLREENKIIYQAHNNNTEGILYDFNLGQGDYGVFEASDSYVQPFHIDTVYIDTLWGKTRNVYRSYSPEFFEYIEGIGSIQSPVFWWWQNNGRLLNYCRGTHNECNTWFTPVENEAKNVSFFVFPNPGNETVNIQYDANTINSLFLYDLQGKMLKEIRLNESGLQAIFVGDLAKGIYFWRINNQYGQKWLKN